MLAGHAVNSDFDQLEGIEFDAGVNFNIWAHKGMLRPLDDLISANKYDIENFFKAALEALLGRWN